MRHIIVCLVVVVVLFVGLSPQAVPAQETAALLLSEPGPYGVGMQGITFVDDSRDGWELIGTIWYPAQAGRSSYLMPEYAAAPDLNGAPFPLIIYSHDRGMSANMTLDMANHLASYGFVVVAPDYLDPRNWINHVNRPMDIVFIIEQMAATNADGAYAGLIDFEHVGVSGYSYGAMATLLVSGASLDPDSIQAYCADETHSPETLCENTAEYWEELAAYRALFEPLPVAGEPWPAITNNRIVATVPVVPCDGPVFGERGLAGASKPILVIGLVEDEVCPYERDAAFIYDHLGSAERYLLSVSGFPHIWAYDGKSRGAYPIFNHFATAFFGYYLQGKADYAQYLNTDFVSGFENLQWASTVEQ